MLDARLDRKHFVDLLLGAGVSGLTVAVAGVVLGLAAAFGLTRVMESILYEVSTTDPLSFTVAPVVLVGVAFLATWLPARRAARVDPVEALRAE